MPEWLHLLSEFSIAIGALCSCVIAMDLLHRPQAMGIMNIVWPTCALFGGPLLLWQYLKFGRSARGPARAMTKTPFAVSVAAGTLHCGSGCTIGDILAESLVLTFPGVAAWFGWHHLFDHQMFAVWVIDYLFAYVLGIAFQYFSIAPMRGLAVRPALRAAIKADTLSLTAWQAGMYGFMAFASFGLFERLLGMPLKADRVEFWFMMQIAMACGFATAYPVNWWLIKRGIKEPM